MNKCQHLVNEIFPNIRDKKVGELAVTLFVEKGIFFSSPPKVCIACILDDNSLEQLSKLKYIDVIVTKLEELDTGEATFKILFNDINKQYSSKIKIDKWFKNKYKKAKEMYIWIIDKNYQLINVFSSPMQ